MLYKWLRDLHLYLGLFLSPFLLLFASSVFFLNHAKVAPDQWTSVHTVSAIDTPQDIDRAQGKQAIAGAQIVLRQIGLSGEIGFTRFVPQTRHFVFPVSRPGLEASVDVDLDARTAVVSSRPTSVLEAFAFLHKMPGPHNANIRGNWWAVRAWKGFADATIYLVLFVSVSGVYLWWVLKAERRVGLLLLSGGTLTLVGLAYVAVR